MGRTTNRLTANEVKAAKGKQMLPDGGGLYLRVSSEGAKSWMFRFRWQGKRPDMGLGPYPAVSLAQARERAELARAALASMPPMDPREALKGDDGRPVPTFLEFAEEWMAANLKEFSNAEHRRQWRSTIEAYARPLHEKRIDAIRTEDVLSCMTPVWDKKRVTAQRVLGRIERLLDAAKAKGFRDGENPARWRGHLKTLLGSQRKPKKHHPAMPYDEVPAFMARLSEQGNTASHLMAFLVLTGVRLSEGRLATWGEIDMEAQLWTVPAERMGKTKQEHRVPLSDAAMALLEPLHASKTGDYVFPGQGGRGHLSETPVRKAFSLAGGDGFTIHGFRSSFRDWAGEETVFPRDIADMALAHLVGNAVERAYRRGDALEKRRSLKQAWDDFCTGKASA